MPPGRSESAQSRTGPQRLKALQRSANCRRVEPADDEDEAGLPVLEGPGIQMGRIMNQMLNALDHDRSCGIRDVQNSLDAEDVAAVPVEE